MTKLTQRKCEPCEGKTRPFTRNETTGYLKEVPGWQLTEDGRGLWRDYTLIDFMAAVDLINKIAAIAHSEDHHPDIHLTGYRRLHVDLTTHAISGLSENDFIVAAKINDISAELKG